MQGFTLIEVLITITVIGALSGIVYYVSVGRTNERSRFNATISDLTQVGQAMKIYLAANNAYPPDAAAGTMPAGFTSSISKWPAGQWQGSEYDYDTWIEGGQTVAQVSLRLCSTSPCTTPTGAWATGLNVNSTMFYCVTGNCRSVAKDPTPKTTPPAAVTGGLCVGGNSTSTTISCKTPTFQ